MKIKCINERFGDSVECDSVEELRRGLIDICGYLTEDDVLVEGVDYEVIEE